MRDPPHWYSIPSFFVDPGFLYPIKAMNGNCPAFAPQPPTTRLQRVMNPRAKFK